MTPAVAAVTALLGGLLDQQPLLVPSRLIIRSSTAPVSHPPRRALQPTKP